MGLLIAQSGSELMSGDRQNVTSDFEGTAMLAPLHNLIPDPLFKQYDDTTDILRYWRLGASPKPNGWMPFVRDKNIERNFSRQATAPIPMDQNVFELKDELVPGASPAGSKDTIDIAAPLRPRVESYMVSSKVGFPAGFYCIAFGWIAGGVTSRRLTGPGPRSDPFELAQGQGFQMEAPTEFPEGVGAVVYYCTAPQSSAAAALNASLYEQQRFTLRGTPKFFSMYGPLSTRRKWDGRNYSFIGGSPASTTQRVETSRLASAGDTNSGDSARVGYRYVTDQGTSESSPKVPLRDAGQTGRVTTVKPESFPEGATGYIPEVEARDGATGQKTNYTIQKIANTGSVQTSNTGGRQTATSGSITQNISVSGSGSGDSGGGGGSPTSGAFPKDQRAPVYGGDPSSVPSGSNTEMNESGGTQTTDETGVERPTDEPSIPTILDLDTSGLTPGKHYVRTALFVNDNEGPASETREIDVVIGKGLRIHRPRWHDRLDNSDLSEKDVDGNPRDWNLFGVTSGGAQVFTEKRNVIRITDNSERTDAANFFTTPPAAVDPNYDRYTMDMRFKFRSYLRGAVEIFITQYDEAGNQIGSPYRFERLSRNAKKTRKNRQFKDELIKRQYRFSKRTDDIGNPYMLKLNPLCVSIKMTAKGGIAGRSGTRTLDVDLADFSMTAGWATPKVLDINLLAAQRTSPVPPPDTVLDHVYQDYTRPHGGYCVAVQDPEDGPKKATYTTKDFTVFETGTTENWVKNVADFNTYINSVRQEAALYSSYGLRLAKTADGTGANNVSKIFTPSTAMSVSWDVFIDTFSSHNVELGSILDANGAVLATVTLTGTGDIVVRHSDAKIQTVALGIDNGNLVHFELSCNLITGVVTLTFGIDRDNREQVVTLTGIDFSTFQNAAQAVLGPRAAAGTNTFARYELMYGKIEVTDLQVFSNIEDLPGDYIEYYGPAGTPTNSKYGPTGMRVPCSANQAYTFGVNVWYEDMNTDASLFILRAKDADGKTLATFEPIVPNIKGDRRFWERHAKTITTPEGTAYIEFFENRLGAGVIKIHGLQMEEGTVMHDFSYLRERSGFFSTYFRSRQPGIEVDDPAAELAIVKSLRKVDIAGIDTETVSFTTRFRSGNTFAELDASPYVADPHSINVQKLIYEVRLDMASTIDGDTPEIRAIEIDLERGYSQLLRENGTEYTGGTLAYEIGVPVAPPHFENLDLASGGRIAIEWGNERITNIHFKIAAFRESTVQEIIASRVHILEMPGVRYTLALNAVPDFEIEPGSRKYFVDGREYFQRWIGEMDCYVIGKELV